MSARGISSLAGVIRAAQQQHLTSRGIALAVDAAGRHMDPETAAELDRLRTEVRQMCNVLDGFNCPPPDETPVEKAERIERLLTEAEARVAELEKERASTNAALEDAVTEVAALRRRVAELEAADYREGQRAEQHHMVLDLDADSGHRLPGCSPMCPPRETTAGA